MQSKRPRCSGWSCPTVSHNTTTSDSSFIRPSECMANRVVVVYCKSTVLATMIRQPFDFVESSYAVRCIAASCCCRSQGRGRLEHAGKHTLRQYPGRGELNHGTCTIQLILITTISRRIPTTARCCSSPQTEKFLLSGALCILRGPQARQAAVIPSRHGLGVSGKHVKQFSIVFSTNDFYIGIPFTCCVNRLI